MFQAPSLFGHAQQDPRIPAWDIFFSGKDGELYQELAWATSRPSSRARECGGEGPAFQSMEQFMACLAKRPSFVLRDFFRALSTSELETMTCEGGYLETPGQVYQLNQKPGFGDASSNFALFTIIRNAGIL